MQRFTFKPEPIAAAVGMVLAGGFSYSQATLGQEGEQVALEEVVVTAQKREEDLLDTPISITTFDTTQLEEINATELTDLNGYVPAFFTAPFAADIAAPVVFIRGMGNVDVQTTKDQAVGVYLDGVVLGRASGLALSVADLERIEVLRGPQGTLYGRNTTGGAINYITNKPHDEFGGKVRFTAGNYNKRGVQLDFNIPFTDRAFFKFAVLKDVREGWVENENVNNLPDQIDPYEHNNDAFNAAFRWEATDNFTFDIAYDRSDMEYGNGYYQVTNAEPADGTFISSNHTVQPTHKRQDKAQFAKGFSPSTVKTEGGNMTLNWDLAAVTLRSITGYRELHSDIFQNYLDGLSYTSNFEGVTPPASEFVQTNQVDQRQFSQEFQAVGSAFGDSLQYVGGLYYFKETSTESQVSDFGVPAGAPGGPYPVDEAWTADSEAESRAIYGQATWRPNALSQKLGVTLGLRYTEDDRKSERTYLSTIDANWDYAGNPIPYTQSGDKDFSNTSGTFVVDYLFTDNINTYAKYATGYRAGGFSTRAQVDSFTEGFDPEEVQSFELGFKSKLWDQRVGLNAAAYYNDYKDLQVANFLPPLYNNTVNAGDATIKGAEIELIARLSRGWTVDAFYAYIDAEYGEYLLPNATGGMTDWSDVKKVPNAPKNQAKVGVEYAFPMMEVGQFTAKLDYLWVDEFWSNPDSTNRNDAYGLWNGRIQWRGIPLPKGEIRMALWGYNLTDEEYTTLTTDFSGGDARTAAPPPVGLPSDQHTYIAQYGMPRTYGMDFIYEF